jgi:hypothetical protein
MRKTTEAGDPDFSWPTITICGMFLGFIIAFHFGSAGVKTVPVDLLNRMLPSRDQLAASEDVLIITADPRDQLTVVATLSPRGFHPLLASSESEVVSQIRAHPDTLKLAVVDATLPDYASIASTLKDTLPLGNIIVLKSSHQSQDIAPLLLDRLGLLRQHDAAGGRRGRRGAAGAHARDDGQSREIEQAADDQRLD